MKKYLKFGDELSEDTEDLVGLHFLWVFAEVLHHCVELFTSTVVESEKSLDLIGGLGDEMLKNKDPVYNLL